MKVSTLYYMLQTACKTEEGKNKQIYVSVNNELLPVKAIQSGRGRIVIHTENPFEEGSE